MNLNVLSVIRSLTLLSLLWRSGAEISSGRIKGDDEPRMVSWRVLEGVTEPFGEDHTDSIPPWKLMKTAADQKAAGLAYQQALHEYGQLLRHPSYFGEMPMEERYDVFLSMSKLLKRMGFHQRAEILLYEAMSYTTNPYEAHLQLGLLFLDKENLDQAKMHLKNCLFYEETDTLILIHLSVILICEGKLHEAKFFLSRIISGLESRVRKLSFILTEKEITSITTEIVDYKILSNWLEDLVVKIFYGEYRITASSAIDLLKMFSNLYRWLSDGEMTGRYVFDLGQSLYEGGRPKIGRVMMEQGFVTSDQEAEGIVSSEIVKMRLSLDFPVIPGSIDDIISHYINMTSYLSETSTNYITIDYENIMDLYWPLPLLQWSGVPMTPVIKELLWRFSGGPVRTDHFSTYWLNYASYDEIVENFHPQVELLEPVFLPSTPTVEEEEGIIKSEEEISGKNEENVGLSWNSFFSSSKPVTTESIDTFDRLRERDNKVVDGVRTVVIPPVSYTPSGRTGKEDKIKIEVGILGGHMNGHPVGQMTFRRIIEGLSSDVIHSNPGNGGKDKSKGSKKPESSWKDLINLTLIALPLVPDAMTRRIAEGAHQIVNLPLDTEQAWKILQNLHLDVVLFPDWQPFPDQQSILFQSRRIAPVQACFFVRGGSCASQSVDYYLIPEELQNSYLRGTPAADIRAKKKVLLRPPPDETQLQNINSSKTLKVLKKPIRPQWKENFVEQVVLLEWPLLTPQVIKGITQTLSNDLHNEHSRLRDQQQSHPNTPRGASGLDESMGDSSSVLFSPLEIEGKIFFEGQPVAVIPLYPTLIHPLMDDVLFRILRSIPSLHLVLALPETFFIHARDAKHKISWARKLVRRLWSRGGNLFQRIRLLPTPLSEQRLVQLLRQADMVLDSFPLGAPFSILALALGAGTPVITMKSGTLLSTPKEDLGDLRAHVQQRQKAFQGVGETGGTKGKGNNPMMLQLVQGDVPWVPTISSVAGFYRSAGLERFFVADSSLQYTQLASNLANNREFAYELRVKILETVDDQVLTNKLSKDKNSNDFTSTWEEVEREGEKNLFNDFSNKTQFASFRECGSCIDDLGRFLVNVGTPWARARKFRQLETNRKKSSKGAKS